MAAFLEYVKEVMSLFFSFNFNNQKYIEAYNAFLESPDANSGGRVMLIIFIVVLVLLIISLVLLIAWAIIKIIRMRKKVNGYDEKAMMEEIERLNLELYDVTKEKDRILSLHREADGVYAPVVEAGGADRRRQEFCLSDPGHLSCSHHA